MIKRTGHIILSAWLAILLLFGSTPKEYIHLFADHHDTVHTHSDADGLVIEPEHHHCSFLSYALPLFINDVQVIKLHIPRLVYPSYNTLINNTYTHNYISTAYLRGPPTFFPDLLCSYNAL